MGQALYRSYRSKSFDEVVGQDHVVDTLSAAIKAGRVSHAYLFTGPRGVGKTSVARILAHAVNELPYEAEGTHLDIIEIDAASNRRIDEIRELRDKVHITPTSGKYKVYIIDEAHMLTKEAFNALLKTLEEPPKHVIFILATTEAHKLPETITSRTQRFNFKPITQTQAVKHLKSIAKKEKIDVNEEALSLIAKHGEGSFRDSISLLDQLSSSGEPIRASDVQIQLGLPKEESVKKLLQAIDAGEAHQVLEALQAMRDSAADASTAAKSISAAIRAQALLAAPSAADLALLKNLLDVSASHNPDELLEIVLLQAAISNSAPAQAPSPIDKPQQEKNEEPKRTNAAPKESSSSRTQNFDLSMWTEVLEQVKHQAASIYTALRLSQPKLEGSELTLYFEFPLHQKKLNQAQAKDAICSIIEKISDGCVNICLLYTS